ncbi:MAG: RNAse Z [Planctomycetota bacterium]
MHLTITTYSAALFSTWVFIEELGLLFDAGDGVSAGLTQKGGKIKNVFITHADRDHICGLLQVHQLNARDGSPTIYYPKDCGSFEPLRDFLARCDPQSGPATWIALDNDQAIDLSHGYQVTTQRSEHVQKDGLVKAFGFTLSHTRKRLKAEFQGLSGKEIATKKQELGEGGISETITDKLLGYSGDSPALIPSDWRGVKLLLHEATFLEPETTRGSHASLPHVIEAASSLSLDALVLMHFSSRYKPDAIKAAINIHAELHKPSFPIFAIMPGSVCRDILKQDPVYRPNECL